MLDSGAYTAYTQGVKINLDDYMEFLLKYGKYFAGGQINLDAIGDGKTSYLNWRKLRQKGIDVIPVYHLGTDEKWLEKYIKNTDYIAIGAIANLNTKARMLGLTHIWKKYLLDGNGQPKVKVHGLGLTSLQIVLVFPWYSVDSAQAIKAAAYGKVMVPKLLNIRKDAQGQIQYNRDFWGSTLLGISDWKPSNSSSSAYFRSLPPTIREAYTKYFEDRGYCIGSPVGNTGGQPRTRKDKKRMKELEKQGQTVQQYKPLLGGEQTQENGTNDETLTNNWNTRCSWNFDFWKEFDKEIPTPHVYHVVTTKAHMKHITHNNLPFLLSYYVLANEGSLFEWVMKNSKKKGGQEENESEQERVTGSSRKSKARTRK